MKGLIKAPGEIQKIAEGGKLLHRILEATAALVKPGISTWELNKFAEAEIVKIGGRPSFKGYGPKKNPFPAGLCTSINDVVVHGIPSKTDLLSEGDIVSLDIGMEYKSFYTDHAVTVPVGRVSKEAQRLMAVTQEALQKAIKEAKAGSTTGDIGYIIQTTAEQAGFFVVRDLVGHGVGYDVHEDPAVPCYGKRGQGVKLKSGMVLAIEPMVCERDYHVSFDPDGWTIRTLEGGLAAHFEHTITITEYGSVVLT